MASCAAHTLSTKLSRAAPCSTYTCQGWVLVPEGERRATSRMSVIISRVTACWVKARADMRLVMA